MKNLFKMLSLVFVLLLTVEINAQTIEIKGGINLANWAKGSTGEDFKMNPGFHVGSNIEFQVSERFLFETGLLFSKKGSKYDEDEKIDLILFRYPFKFKSILYQWR